MTGVDGQRRIFLAVDASKTLREAKKLIQMTMGGPIGAYILGIKLNDLLHAPFSRSLIKWIRATWPELELFPDLKLGDICATNLNTIRRYADGEGESSRVIYVTLAISQCAPKTFVGLAEKFPKVQAVAMGVPTDWTPQECFGRYGMSPRDAMCTWLQSLSEQYNGIVAGKGLRAEPCQSAIASVDMLEMMGNNFPSVGPITPGICDSWMSKRGQERVTGIIYALGFGGEVVLGSQLTKGNPDKGISAEESQRLTADEIEKFLSRTA